MEPPDRRGVYPEMNVGRARFLADREIFVDVSEPAVAIRAGFIHAPSGRVAPLSRAPMSTPMQPTIGLTKGSQRGGTPSFIASK